MTSHPYHHGDLRRVLLQAAVGAIDENGIAALSLRDLARRAGVSHAAPAHHFGDKAGLLTALAAEGFDLLADRVGRAYARTRDVTEAGAAYVSFALDCQAHFEVMFRPELYYANDDEVRAARERARQELRKGLAETRGTTPDAERARIATWALAHGFATLVLTGNVPATNPAAEFTKIASAFVLRRGQGTDG
jgi:AcrR family transcriptional regulator